ncbi:MAG: hypothetical protein KDK27_10910 [Leptospiraceae bacterium]|nr:hypothetical protein [Leptospiraceae bacterium]
MKRKQIPQLMNQSWFPSLFTELMMEFLTWFVNLVGAAKPFMPVIDAAMLSASRKHFINMDFQAGAGFETVAPRLDASWTVSHIPLQAVGFSAGESGLYLSINNFHQLHPDDARSILTEIARSRNPVAILEGNNDSLWQIFGMTVIVPLTVILSAPFVKPFRISRLLFTYVIPLLPCVTMIDGCLALVKLYSPADLRELTDSIDAPGEYIWETGKKDNGRGGKIIYLTGRAEK